MSFFFVFFGVMEAAVKGYSRRWYNKFDYGFCFVLWDILSLAVVAHTVEYAVHSLISLLAKLKISAHHRAKASSTMPGIFLNSNQFALI